MTHQYFRHHKKIQHINNNKYHLTIHNSPLAKTRQHINFKIPVYVRVSWIFFEILIFFLPDYWQSSMYPARYSSHQPILGQVSTSKSGSSFVTWWSKRLSNLFASYIEFISMRVLFAQMKQIDTQWYNSPFSIFKLQAPGISNFRLIWMCLSVLVLRGHASCA